MDAFPVRPAVASIAPLTVIGFVAVLVLLGGAIQLGRTVGVKLVGNRSGA